MVVKADVRVACLICSYGDPAWYDVAYARAHPSAADQGFDEVIVYHHPAGTLASVRNEAAAAADADALVFLDADDELEPGYLRAMCPRLCEHGPGALLVPAVRRVFADGRETRPTIPQRGRWPALNECVIGTAVSREVFLGVGGFRELPSLEDYDLFLRCWDAGARLVYVPDAVYREHVSPVGGRNRDQSCYSRVWRDHLARGAA